MMRPDVGDTADRRGIEAEGPPLAQVFKTVHAGHTGKLSYARIWRGEIKDGATLGGTRLGGIYHVVNGDISKVGRGTRRARWWRSAAWMACRPARRCPPPARPSRCRSPKRCRRCTRWRSPPPTTRTM